MIWTVIALMAVMLVASRPCSDTQPGWLLERLSVVRWMGLGLTSTTNLKMMQCLLQTCCIGSYYLCHWRYMTPEWTLYQQQNNEEPYHQSNASSKNDNYFKAWAQHRPQQKNPRKRCSEHGIRDETCQDVRGLRLRERVVGPVSHPRLID
jgi:hypothetical protein